MTQLPPRSAQFDDVYFSAQDGMAETQHVFMTGNNLPHRWQEVDQFTVAETGFGTGLNFLTCWKSFQDTAKPGAFLDFVSIEKYPLTAQDIARYLMPWRGHIGREIDMLCAQYPLRVPGFHRLVFDQRVALTLIFEDVSWAMPRLNAHVDAWFLDGFTPAKNPDMWTDHVFQHMARLSASCTSFATFTAAGHVRRGLEQAGFHVEKTKGFGFKREMMRGLYTGQGNRRPEPLGSKKIAIIGAGLAGSACAYALRQYGASPTIYEQSAQVASGASGNRRGLYNPRFSAFRDPSSDFYTSAFALMTRMACLFSDEKAQVSGTLHLLNDTEKQKKLSRTVDHWHWHTDHMTLLTPEESSEISGVRLNHSALYLPDAGSISPHDLCHFYTQEIDVRISSPVKDIRSIDADIIILCQAIDALDIYPDLPIHTVRGQITYVQPNEVSANLRTNLCYGGYISSAHEGEHVIGSSFQRWLSHTVVMSEDDMDNITKLNQAVPSLGEFKPKNARAALRCSSRDRFPMIGKKDDNVYLSLAHGSHGLISTLAGAHYLADLVRGGVVCLPSDTALALSPGRFLSRS
ncbi:MAG: tRNA (5-methylaminomethyl-2-thiouridine)(34)-methyltransferase MnmD [Alphaproteobacteria bacterium]|nr:tRNA (5-methylaminomethyl-2-thiouridine)(34)-methyltransferase MnmD [Alphaproteobacteria bacterium]